MKFLILLIAGLAVVSAFPLESDVQEEEEEYVLVPVSRIRRDLTWGANQGGYSLGQKGTLFGNDNHKLDGSYSGSKAWNSHGLKPDAFGGRLDYTHNPSGSTAFVGANRRPGYGTDVSAGVKYNIAQGKNWDVGVSAQYDRRFGGPYGTGKKDVNVLFGGSGRF